MARRSTGSVRPAARGRQGTDFHATSQGLVSITPLQDLTERGATRLASVQTAPWAPRGRCGGALSRSHQRAVAVPCSAQGRGGPVSERRAAPRSRCHGQSVECDHASLDAAAQRDARRGTRVRAPSGVGLDSAQVRAHGATPACARHSPRRFAAHTVTVPRHTFIDTAPAAQAYEDTACRSATARRLPSRPWWRA